MASYLFLIPVLPLLAAVINLLLGRSIIGHKAHWIATPAVFASWAMSLAVLWNIHDTGHGIEQKLYTWIPSGSFNVPVNLVADQLTAIMLVVVTSVGLLVHVYSTEYMKGDPGFYRFFAYLPLFVFSMLMLVLADNFLLLFVFWEAVGLCSYLLIGFWYQRRSAGNAAKKAFIVNRIGDLGFGLGVMMIFWTFGTLQFSEVFAHAAEASGTTLTIIALLLFTGACGKSAQFPLHVWLPDAMEGPTPVSALIHAATMVTAGIYLIARSQAIVSESATAMLVIAGIGALTAFMGASIAITQNDIKRIVAYSTVSQLGYMAFALGTGAWASAIFHLMTHAFFKGLLFLGCGSVIHGMHHEQDIQKMGNLRKYMPITFWTFLVGSLANAGVVPLAGFWSKDELIVGAWASLTAPTFGKVVAVVGLAAAFMTAFYMFRLVFLTFFTTERFDKTHVHPHESKPAMALPLVILAVPSIFIGFVGFPPDAGPFHRFLEPVFSHGGEEEHAEESAALYVVSDGGTATDAVFATSEEGERGEEAGGHGHITTRMKWTFGIISTIVAFSGIGLAYLTYVRKVIDPVKVAASFQGLYLFLYNRWRIDEFYDRTLVQPIKRMSIFLWQVVDVRVIDGTVNGAASSVTGLSGRLRKVQTGFVSNYALAIVFGMVLIVAIYFVGFSSLEIAERLRSIF